jgi:hypothetical protein
MQQPVQSSSGMLAKKVIVAILPCEDKVTMEVNQGYSDPALDELTQPKSNKRCHNEAAHFVPCVLSLGARKWLWRRSQVNNLIFRGHPPKKG